MSDLILFRDHARRMVTAAHHDGCKVSTTSRFGTRITNHPDPDCGGCVTPAQRDLWARLADEVDAYLHRHPEEMTLL